MLVRITDFYCKVYNHEYSSMLTYLLTDELNQLKFEYYEYSDVKFNYFIKDNVIEYKNKYKEVIIKLFNEICEKYSAYFEKRNDITVIYDDNVLNVFGKELYLSTFEDVKVSYKTNFNIDLNINFKHIINAIPGEVISIETDFGSGKYSLRSFDFDHWIITDKNKCPGIKGKEGTKYNGYIIDEEKYLRNKIPKYFTVIDFNAHQTNYYTYKLEDRITTLYNKDSIDIGFIDIVEWVFENLDFKYENKYNNYIDIMKKIYMFNNTQVSNITREQFYKNSPLTKIIRRYIDFKHDLLDKLSLNDKVYIKCNIENIVEVPLKHIEIDQRQFNGNCNRVLENYYYLEEARNKTLKFGNSYSSNNLVDEVTGSSNFNIVVNLSDMGYDYEFEDLKEYESI